jgi:hypothetical protein
MTDATTISGLYFEGDYPELESRLENHFARVRESFETRGCRGSLVLGGGYGRGEGGVMAGPDGLEFSNDLDYFLFDDCPDEPTLVAWCRGIERKESAVLGIDVEIKCLRADSIGDPSRSMMFADLVAGHVVVAGDGGFLEKHRENLDFSRIDPAEASRLLWNRGSGMYFARCRLGQEGELKFVIRNHAKLKLALGDGWLCLNGQYTSKCRERGERLALCELPENLEWLREWHAEGVEFKFRPFSDGPTWAELEEESRKLIEAWGRVYLAAEEKRLKRKLPGFSEYLRLPRLLNGTPVVKNLLLSVRDKLKRGGFIRPVGDYPRAGLMRALPCLLDLAPGGVPSAGRFLPKPSGDPSQVRAWEHVYSKWWAYYA